MEVTELVIEVELELGTLIAKLAVCIVLLPLLSDSQFSLNRPSLEPTYAETLYRRQVFLWALGPVEWFVSKKCRVLIH